jgi:hypothetical protein
VSAASPDGPFASARTFCIFIGYPRSGHSLIGSLLDAHPRMVVAHELDALKLVEEGVSKRELYEQIVANSERAAAAGREQTGYSYAVPGQWQGRFEEIQVLGDKKGGMSTVRLRERPELLDQLAELVGLPLKLIHVVRNPYDNIATIATKPNTEMPKESRTAVGVPEATRRYFDRCETVAEIGRRVSPADLFHLRHEGFLGDPVHNLSRLCRFLGQEASDEYLADCRQIVFPEGRRSRADVEWTDEAREAVAGRIEDFDFLRGYSLET